MRTVTFSDPRVAEHVNGKYVAVWYNRGKGFHNCELRTELGIFGHSADAYPTRNICTFLLTPDREVLFYVSGYYCPDLYLEILQTGERLAAARDEAELKRLHREFAALAASPRTAKRGEKAPAGASWPERVGRFREVAYEGARHAHGPACAESLRPTLDYFRTVHEKLSKEGRVPLEKVQHDYLYGNPFSEEPPAAGPGEFPRPRSPATPGGK